MVPFMFCLSRILVLLLIPMLSRADHLSKIPSGSLLYDIQNPFVFIPRVQFENHFDTGIGPSEASSYRLRMRPIIPVDINEDWGLRTRTTINMTYQSAIYPGGPNQLGFGDTDLEFYFSPNRSLAHDALVVGAGPSVHIPTATQSMIGLNQWGLGASAAVIWQPATIYALKGFTLWSNVNQSFGIGAGDGRQAMKFLFLQPGFSYTFASDVSLGLYSETAYNWNTDQWTIPVNASISTLIAPGGQNVVITFAGRYYAERGLWDPQWGAQLNFNFLFP